MHPQPPRPTLFPYTTLFRSALSPDHRTAYVALGEDNALGVIDVAAAKMTGTLPAGRDPELVVLSPRSEEHTSELQSHSDLVCRLLLEKKKKKEISNSEK